MFFKIKTIPKFCYCTKLDYCIIYENERYIPIDRCDHNPYETDYVSGADFFIRSAIIEKVGNFDKRFFLYSEETELSFRIKKMIPSARCIINPEAKIVHIGQGSHVVNSARDKMFRFRFIKSRSLYYFITKGFFYGVSYFIISSKQAETC